MNNDVLSFICYVLLHSGMLFFIVYPMVFFCFSRDWKTKYSIDFIMSFLYSIPIVIFISAVVSSAMVIFKSFNF